MKKSPEEYKRELGRLLKYYEALINKALNEALQKFNSQQAGAMYLFSKSDMATVMHAYIRASISELFDNVPGCYIVGKPGRAFMLFLDGKPIGIDAFAGLKFKKQLPNLRTANIQTDSVIRFNSQQQGYLSFFPEIQVALMPEFGRDRLTNPPKTANVIAGYQPNITWTGFDRLTLTFPLSDRKIEMLADITNIDPPVDNVLPMLPKPMAPKRTRIRRRGAPQKLKKLKVEGDGKDS